MDVPDTQYARSGNVYVAYQAFGNGPFDLVVVPGALSNIEYCWQSQQSCSDPNGGTILRLEQPQSAWFGKPAVGKGDGKGSEGVAVAPTTVTSGTKNPG